MRGCDRCTVRVDQAEWDAIAGGVMQLGAALEARDAEWADGIFRRIADAVSAIEEATPLPGM